MHQLTQQLKSGQMEIVEVPIPQLLPGQVLVHNQYSVISAGTEGKTVSDARKGYIAKARSRQKEVKQILDLVRTQGIKATYDMVMNKLEALSPLGYSCAGEVIALADDITEFKVGDRVACGGNTAVHADIVAVPKNLCTKIPLAVPTKEAAFTTIASIAMQGIRQSGVQVGGNCVVIGLGLIGIITMKILEASGIRPIGIDTNIEAVERAIQKYKFEAILRSQQSLEEQIHSMTGGFGTDSVIITAATSSTDPVNLAGEICRQKGVVVIVGAVPTGFDRKNFYRKELDLRMSASYGPGRYDAVYEEQGIDYPIGYVRWTEHRNMQSILQLLATGKIHFDDLISHSFNLENAPDAYTLILEKSEPHLGIILQYREEVETIKTIQLQKLRNSKMQPNVGIIGAGSFAQNIVLPILKHYSNLVGIATSTGNSALYTGRKYKMAFVSTEPTQIIASHDVNTVFILTRHQLHAKQTIEALQAGKNVFVEKPLALSTQELADIASAYSNLPEPRPLLMTGFNRRFAPAVQEIKKRLSPVLPKAINLRVNAGNLPAGHWVHDPKIGGGRILGEACHFIDLAYYLAGSKAIGVSAIHMNAVNTNHDTVCINLQFENGSVATISYFSNGNKQVEKESVEVFCGQAIARIHDFKSIEIFTGNKKFSKKYTRQDKGHTAEIIAFTQAIELGQSSPIPFEEIVHSLTITFAVQEALKENRIISIS